MCKTTILECRYCDGSISRQTEDVRICISCGAEWDPVEVEVELTNELEKDSNCLQCGKSYCAEISMADADEYFCSIKCEEKYNDEKFCEFCTSEFSAKEAGNNHYCSAKCEELEREAACS